MTDNETEPEDHAAPEHPDAPGEWAVDAAIGAVSTAGRAAAAVGRSTPGRAAAAAARFVTAPLTEEGHEVRERAVPVAKEVLQQVTPEVVEAVNINDILAAIDIDALLDRVDVQRIIDRVDVAAIVEKVDVDELVGAVDVQAIIDRVDIGALIERVDLNEIVSRVDIDKLMSETELGSIIAQSTSGVAAQALDAVRRQGVSLDNVVARLSNRILRRDPQELSAGPPLLVGIDSVSPPGDLDLSGSESSSDRDEPPVGAEGPL